MGKISLFIDHYIKGKYHCDTCSYCWGGGQNYAGDYEEAGCYIKGDIQDSCRLLPPFRFFLGFLGKKKAEYHFNHEYDDFSEFAATQETNQQEFNRLLNDFLKKYELCRKDKDGIYHPINTEGYIRQEAWRIRSDYDDFAYPVVHISIRKQWKNVIKNTFNFATKKIKPYICK